MSVLGIGPMISSAMVAAIGALVTPGVLHHRIPNGLRLLFT
jgi:hypothetical protein